MTRMTKRVLSAVILLAAAVPATAGEKKEESKTAGGDKATKYVSGTTIDFCATLELNFSSLCTLGSRIEQCRTTSPDPVGLAACAHELAIAEKVCGKKASLTSAALLEEAIHMARVRYDSTEIKALLHYVKSEKARDDLETVGLRAERAEKIRTEQAKNGVATKGITSHFYLHNDSHQWVRVYYNRRRVGQVRPHGHGTFHIHDHSPYWDVSAYGSRGSRWHRHKRGQVRNYTWTIHSHR